MERGALMTFHRRLELLMYIQRAVEPKSVHQMVAHLVEEQLLDDGGQRYRGRQTKQTRTVQKDLDMLCAGEVAEAGEPAGPFALVWQAGEQEASERLWSVHDPLVQEAGKPMSRHLALALAMAEKHLDTLFSDTAHSDLVSHFQLARRRLGQMTGSLQREDLQRLTKRTLFSQRGQRLEAAPYRQCVLDAVYDAIARHRQLSVSYRRADDTVKSYQLHPLGVVVQSPKIYLLAYKDGTQEVRQFLIHRIQEAGVLTLSARDSEDFNLERHVHDGHMQLALADDRRCYDIVIRLHQPSVGLLQDLRDCPLQSDQQLLVDGDGYLLKLTICYTVQLRNWIMGLGAVAEVVEPANVRADIGRCITAMAQRYETSGACSQIAPEAVAPVLVG